MTIVHLQVTANNRQQFFSPALLLCSDFRVLVKLCENNNIFFSFIDLLPQCSVLGPYFTHVFTHVVCHLFQWFYRTFFSKSSPLQTTFNFQPQTLIQLSPTYKMIYNRSLQSSWITQLLGYSKSAFLLTGLKQQFAQIQNSSFNNTPTTCHLSGTR